MPVDGMKKVGGKGHLIFIVRGACSGGNTSQPGGKIAMIDGRKRMIGARVFLSYRVCKCFQPSAF